MNRQKISKALEHLDEELIAGALDATAEQNRKGGTNMTRQRKIKMWSAIAAALVLLVTGAFALTYITRSNKPNTIIALDVNPSLEIEVNDKEEVVRINTLNEDAVIVVGDMDFENVDLDVAVNALVGAMLRHGYLTADQNSILISVDASDTARAEALQKTLSDTVTQLLEGSNIQASIMTQTFSKNDANLPTGDVEVSAAQATLIQKILDSGLCDAYGTPYTYDRLAGFRVNELKLILESKGLKVEGIDYIGAAAGYGDLITAEEALAIVLEKAGVNADDVTGLDIELDSSKWTESLFYEIEFKAGGMKYEYELIASTGDILKEEIEAADDDDDRAPDSDLYRPGSPEEYIHVREALLIVCEDAGRHEKTKGMEYEFKLKNGCAVYEIEFEDGEMEYEYLIDAKTGEIVDKKISRDD